MSGTNKMVNRRRQKLDGFRSNSLRHHTRRINERNEQAAYLVFSVNLPSQETEGTWGRDTEFLDIWTTSESVVPGSRVSQQLSGDGKFRESELESSLSESPKTWSRTRNPNARLPKTIDNPQLTCPNREGDTKIVNQLTSRVLAIPFSNSLRAPLLTKTLNGPRDLSYFQSNPSTEHVTESSILSRHWNRNDSVGHDTPPDRKLETSQPLDECQGPHGPPPSKLHCDISNSRYFMTSVLLPLLNSAVVLRIGTLPVAELARRLTGRLFDRTHERCEVIINGTTLDHMKVKGGVSVTVPSVVLKHGVLLEHDAAEVAKVFINEKLHVTRGTADSSADSSAAPLIDHLDVIACCPCESRFSSDNSTTKASGCADLTWERLLQMAHWEELFQRTILSQAWLCLSTLAPGGAFIFRGVEFQSTYMISLLFTLSTVFQSIYIICPGKLLAAERYVICTNFIGLADAMGTLDLLMFISSAWSKASDGWRPQAVAPQQLFLKASRFLLSLQNVTEFLNRGVANVVPASQYITGEMKEEHSLFSTAENTFFTRPNIRIRKRRRNLNNLFLSIGVKNIHFTSPPIAAHYDPGYPLHAASESTSLKRSAEVGSEAESSSEQSLMSNANNGSRNRSNNGSRNRSNNGSPVVHEIDRCFASIDRVLGSEAVKSMGDNYRGPNQYGCGVEIKSLETENVPLWKSLWISGIKNTEVSSLPLGLLNVSELAFQETCSEHVVQGSEFKAAVMTESLVTAVSSDANLLSANPRFGAGWQVSDDRPLGKPLQDDVLGRISDRSEIACEVTDKQTRSRELFSFDSSLGRSKGKVGDIKRPRQRILAHPGALTPHKIIKSRIANTQGELAPRDRTKRQRESSKSADNSCRYFVYFGQPLEAVAAGIPVD